VGTPEKAVGVLIRIPQRENTRHGRHVLFSPGYVWGAGGLSAGLCVAVWCIVLHYVAACCSVLQRV